ncbi:UbiH/UbiF/VisC/COQ6 family ubiquinone biosynthesis hydroxylase [Thalassolituus sp. LLYu03]|uniref:UbiH/UbiF/VisC/COQ6 family ubiquinone biosynthesis hydroxylase n=1 Tax=Thalassolituus sp. LLYu03 TaxID=3421656 RepID=UPI003D2AA584
MQYDVVIVGAGLVGQAIAAALAQGEQGLRIALVDPAYRADAPAFGAELADIDLRVSALTAKSQAFLSRLGAWQKIPANALSPYTAMKVWDAEGTGSVTFSAADLHVPALGHIVENKQTLWALQQCVAAAAIDIVAEPVRYIDNRNDAGFTPVVLNNGETLLAKLVVGADGALSRIRQWAGLPAWEWDYGHHAIVATVRCEQPLQATAWQRFRPQGPLAFLPLAQDPHLASIVWSTSPEEADEVLALSDDDFNNALSAAFEGRLGKVLESSAKARFPLRQRHAKDYWCEGVVLAGDAAHTIHPLAGQGVNLGFKDAETLAEEILRAQAKGLDIGSELVLSRYQRRRQADNLATMAVMEGFKQLFGSDLPLVRLLRNEGMRLFDKLLPVKQHVVMKAMGLD